MILWAFADAAASLRPYVHVFLAYAAAWILILVWVWRIARALKRLGPSAVEEGEPTRDG